MLPCIAMGYSPFKPPFIDPFRDKEPLNVLTDPGELPHSGDIPGALANIVEFCLYAASITRQEQTVHPEVAAGLLEDAARHLLSVIRGMTPDKLDRAALRQEIEQNVAALKAQPTENK